MLLFPTKNMNPDLTIMAISSVLIKHLKKHRFETLEGLRAVIEKHNKRGASLLEPSLKLLFILGLVEYHGKNDLVEYLT